MAKYMRMALKSLLNAGLAGVSVMQDSQVRSLEDNVNPTTKRIRYILGVSHLGKVRGDAKLLGLVKNCLTTCVTAFLAVAFSKESAIHHQTEDSPLVQQLYHCYESADFERKHDLRGGGHGDEHQHLQLVQLHLHDHTSLDGLAESDCLMRGSMFEGLQV